MHGNWIDEKKHVETKKDERKAVCGSESIVGGGDRDLRGPSRGAAAAARIELEGVGPPPFSCCSNPGSTAYGPRGRPRRLSMPFHLSTSCASIAGIGEKGFHCCGGRACEGRCVEHDVGRWRVGALGACVLWNDAPLSLERQQRMKHPQRRWGTKSSAAAN